MTNLLIHRVWIKMLVFEICKIKNWTLISFCHYFYVIHKYVKLTAGDFKIKITFYDIIMTSLYILLSAMLAECGMSCQPRKQETDDV